MQHVETHRDRETRSCPAIQTAGPCQAYVLSRKDQLAPRWCGSAGVCSSRSSQKTCLTVADYYQVVHRARVVGCRCLSGCA